RYNAPQHKNKLPFKMMTLKEFTSEVFLENSEERKFYYLQDSFYRVPRLREEITLPNLVAPGQLKHVLFWMGRSEIVSRLHYDVYENLFVHLKGEKRFFIAPPGTRGYYPFPLWGEASFVSQVDIDHVDRLRFQQFDRKRGYEILLKAGDCL